MATSSTSDTPAPTAAELIAARPHLSMHAMDGMLIDDVPLNGIADEIGTPVWVYSASAMRRRYRMLAGALADAGLDAHVHYAMKANDRLAVLRLFAAEGAGADIVSEGELRRAREAGIPADRIVFSGVGKSERELRLALSEDIAQINVESAEELDMLSALAAAMDRTARVVFRVNPDVDAGTHAKITTGRARDKFGIPYADIVPLYRRAASNCRVSARSDWRRISAARSCRWRLIAPPMVAWRTWCGLFARMDCQSVSSTAAAGSAFRTATNPRHCQPRSPVPSAARCTTSMCAWSWNRAAGWSGPPACCWRPSSWQSTPRAAASSCSMRR